MSAPLAVVAAKKEVILYESEVLGQNNRLSFLVASDGLAFEKAKIFNPIGLKNKPGIIHDLRFNSQGSKTQFSFLRTVGKNTFLFIGTSSGLPRWGEVKEIVGINEPAIFFVPNKSRRLLFFGSHKIRLATASARGHWKIINHSILHDRPDYFDDGSLAVGQARSVNNGVLLTYFTYRQVGDKKLFCLGAALLDEILPEKVLWRSDFPLWEQSEEIADRQLKYLGELDFNGKSFLYLADQDNKVYRYELPLWGLVAPRKTLIGRLGFNRHFKNPILSPKPENNWESKAAFNPAAFVAGGRVHLIYRAIGDDDISSFGYASSSDGLHFDERLDYPIYVPRKNFEGRSLKKPVVPSPFVSGGTGIGGCEDPRVSLIGDTLYMTYVAFDGYNPPRVALSSINVDDFLEKKFDWKDPVLISPYIPGEGNKNSAILPEKINGQYVVFHRIWPNILLDFTPDLHFDGKKKFLTKQGHAKIRPRKNHWDSRKIGIGAAPIKTEAGWLLIYQAVGRQDPGKYKIGAMLLDLKDPTKVVARSNTPVLEPETWYENEGWKYGVVYPCGATIFNGELFVYYGGSDMYTCVAKANLTAFLEHLLTHKSTTLEEIKL